jgi:hypothetical protein
MMDIQPGREVIPNGKKDAAERPDARKGQEAVLS